MKVNYTQLRKLSQDKHNKLCDDCQIFWAFSNKQFDEGLEKLKLPKGEKLVSIGMGGYLPKMNRDKFINGLDELKAWEKKARKQIKAEQIIEYELSNHECYYTGDITDAWEILKEMGYSKDQVIKVYNKTYSKYDY